MAKIRAAVIGVGHLGKFHVEKFAHLPSADLVGVVDVDEAQCQAIAAQHATTAYSNYHDLLGKVDAVSIVVPTQLHHPIAKYFLENNVHVLLEKPMTVSLEEADELITLAEKHRSLLQIGHLERFNPALLALQGTIDNPQFIESYRIAPFNLRAGDVNVIFDLMIHDIDLIQNMVHAEITQMEANGLSVLTDKIDIANVRLHFDNGCVANVTASRAGTKLERKMRLFQAGTYISLDLQATCYDLYQKGQGEMFPGIPAIERAHHEFDKGDALLAEISAFLDCITAGVPPLVTGQDGRRALQTAIRITQQAQQPCTRPVSPSLL